MNKTLTLITIVALLPVGCRKEIKTAYRIEDQYISKNNGNKNTLKNDLEFVSILYSDLFNQSITNQQLGIVSNVSLACGDKPLVSDMLLGKLLNVPIVDIATKTEMQNDPETFISNAYKKFLTREPNEFELFYLKNLIQKDTSITPQMIYYSLGSCNEYRFY